ncbi:MAG: hypothetical protein AAGH87_08475 [Pseudomonadota bacterium]
MRLSGIAAGLAALITLSACATGPQPGDPCYHDRDALLALDFDRFDRNLEGGWRDLGDDPQCYGVAADSIETYRISTATTSAQTQSLVHHEAQMRAADGQSRSAIGLIETLLPLRADNPEMQAYHEAEIAFLRRDRSALLAARARLLSVPPPEGFEEAVADFLSRYPGQPPPAWPVNLDVVDGFIACFDRPYAEAYGAPECRS